MAAAALNVAGSGSDGVVGCEGVGEPDGPVEPGGLGESSASVGVDRLGESVPAVVLSVGESPPGGAAVDWLAADSLAADWRAAVSSEIGPAASPPDAVQPEQVRAATTTTPRQPLRTPRIGLSVP